jgi:glycosyltransferase involved in cell wall biosynthesis
MQKIVFVSNSSFSMIYFRKGVLLDAIKQGYEVHVIAPRDDLTQQVIDMGCIYHQLNFSTKSLSPIADLRLFFMLWRLYRIIKPSMAFHFTVKPNIYGTLAAYLLFIPSAAIVTGLGYAFITQTWINSLVKNMYRYALRFSDEVWFLNGDDIKFFKKYKLVPERKIVQLPGEGVNTEEFDAKPINELGGTTIFLMIARVLKDKGVYEYIEAARNVKQLHPNVEFWLLGPTDSDNPTAINRQTVQSWVDEGIITYLGVSYNVKSVIEKANCVVLPSYREGISKVLMEAAAMRRPLIASRVAGCKELIEDGVNGLLCEPRDASDLKDKLMQFLQLPSHVKVLMGEQSRLKILARFDEKRVIEIYRKALNKFTNKQDTIVYVVNTDWFFISHRFRLAIEAQKRGYEVIVIASDTGRGEEIRDYGIKFIDLNFNRSDINPIRELKVVWSLVSIYFRYRPQLVHHVTIKPVLYGTLATMLTLSNIYVVNAISGLGYAFINNYRTLSYWVISAFMKLVYSSKRVNFIFQNPDDLAFYKEQKFLTPTNYKLIRGAGIDVFEWPYTPPVVKSSLVVLFSGRMLEDKGVIEFIDAANSLYQTWAGKVIFKLAGGIDSGNPKAISQDIIESKSISGYLEWVGQLDDMKAACIEADIVVLPSYREGLPKSLLEAMAIGRPIITTDVPGCRECVDQDKNGFLIPAKESEPLALAIEVLLKNKPMREQMGQASRVKAINEFSLEQVIDSTFEFYDQVTGNDTNYQTTEPKITIITAVYNNKRFIRDAIESVLSQTYTNVEYIVIDGGSTDGSMDIIKSYEGKIHILVSEPDKGLYDALNKGIALATGEIIGIMHSDDFFAHRLVLEKVAMKFTPKTDAVFGDLDYVSSQDAFKVTRQWRTKKYIKNKFRFGWMPPHPTVFIRKTIFEKYGAYNTSLRSSSDYELLIRLFYINSIRVKLIRDVLVKMRVGGQSNRSLVNRLKAHFEDYKAWYKAGSKPAIYTMMFKLIRKLPQYRIWQ